MPRRTSGDKGAIVPDRQARVIIRIPINKAGNVLQCERNNSSRNVFRKFSPY